MFGMFMFAQYIFLFAVPSAIHMQSSNMSLSDQSTSTGCSEVGLCSRGGGERKRFGGDVKTCFAPFSQLKHVKMKHWLWMTLIWKSMLFCHCSTLFFRGCLYIHAYTILVKNHQAAKKALETAQAGQFWTRMERWKDEPIVHLVNYVFV